MLAGEARKAQLPLGAVAIFTVKPGQLWDRQFSTLTGNRQEAQMAITENKVVKLAQEQIADAVGLQTCAVVVSLDGRIGMNLQLPEGQVAELPAHM